MKSLKLMCGAAVLSLMFVAPVCAADPPAAVDAGQSRQVLSAGGQMTTTAVVKAIDLPDRVVTLTTEDGQDETMQVGEEARNLAQLAVGDRVEVTYKVGLAVKLAPAGAADTEQSGEAATLDRTKLGDKPGGTIRRTVHVEATVRAIDQKNRMVTLQGPHQTVTVKVAPDVSLAKVNVGDHVSAVYQESLALKVEPAASTDGN